MAKRTQKPRQTVDRYLQELHILGILHVDEVGDGQGWRYSLSDHVDREAVAKLRPPKSMPGKVSTPGYEDKEEKPGHAHVVTDFSGHGVEQEQSELFEKAEEVPPDRCACGAQFYTEDSRKRGWCRRCEEKRIKQASAA